MKPHLALVALVIFISYATAQVINSRTESIMGVGMGDYHKITSSTYPIKSHNPDAQEQGRIIVEWGKVSMGYDLTWSVMDDDYLKNWRNDDSLRPDRKLSLRGKMLIISEDGKSRNPIDWIQGVRVIVSRLPEKKLNWANRVEAHNAIWGDTVILKDGEFLVSFPPGEIYRGVGKELRFQVALSLAEKKGQTITWKGNAAVLPQSVAMLTIPGPPPISETMQIINSAPPYDQDKFNPVNLVRAVNHLMPMGKEKVIRELRAFLKIARDSTDDAANSPCPLKMDRREEDIDTSDRSSVFLIVRLLFESEDPFTPWPDILRLPSAPVPEEKENKFWPLYPLYLQNDIPFFLLCGGELVNTNLTKPEKLVNWAEKHGRIRSQLLRPIDNPMIAAEHMIALPQTRRFYKDQDYDFKDIIYQQAWNIIEDVDQILKRIKPTTISGEPDWNARVKAASQLNIRWSEENQKYIIEEKTCDPVGVQQFRS